jgi:hypothetical protein
MTQRLAVQADYTATKSGQRISGRVAFVARIEDSSKGYNLVERARRAVARRLRVRLADVQIDALISD